MYRVNSLETYSMTFNYKKVIIFVVFFKKTDKPQIYCQQKTVHVIQSTSVPVLIQLSKAHSYLLKGY